MLCQWRSHLQPSSDSGVEGSEAEFQRDVSCPLTGLEACPGLQFHVTLTLYLVPVETHWPGWSLPQPCAVPEHLQQGRDHKAEDDCWVLCLAWLSASFALRILYFCCRNNYGKAWIFCEARAVGKHSVMKDNFWNKSKSDLAICSVHLFLTVVCLKPIRITVQDWTLLEDMHRM